MISAALSNLHPVSKEQAEIDEVFVSVKRDFKNKKEE